MPTWSNYMYSLTHRLEIVADARPLDRGPLLAEGALGDLEQLRALLECLRSDSAKNGTIRHGRERERQRGGGERARARGAGGMQGIKLCSVFGSELLEAVSGSESE